MRLGLAHLLRHGYLREAVIRVVVPLDPSRYLELPAVYAALAAHPGQHVLDLASPKLLAVALAREGVNITSVDAFEEEIERWRTLTRGLRRLSFERADGRALPFATGNFDHAYSVSVLEHIPGDGDRAALAELARVVRPGGRVLLTLPYAEHGWDEFRDRSLYGAESANPDRAFFQRWYDEHRVERLLGAAPGLRLLDREVVRLQPNLNDLYNRLFPLLVPLGPLFGVLARERAGPGGDVIRLSLERLPQP